jgi:hypothetical protein
MLNTTHFVKIAGTNSWDDEMRERIANGENLCQLQEEFSDRGHRSISLVRSLYGWYLRYTSGLQDRGIVLHNRGSLSKAEVVEWGRAWVAEDPQHREFIALRDDVADLGI